MSKYVQVKVGERSVKLSNLQKVLYPGAGITKAEIIQYYLSVVPRMLPFIFNRPLSQVRWPDGIEKQKFYQKNKPGWAPEWVTSVLMGRETQVDYMLIDEDADLIWMANLACLEIHNCNTRTPDIDKPNYFVFDIDPPAGAGFDTVKKTAFLLKDFFEEKGYNTFVKTSGGKGIHILCPIHPNYLVDKVVEKTKILAKAFIEVHPDHTLKVSKTVRKDKTLLDVYRNHSSQTIVSPYSLRGKPGATVSTPLTWDELDMLSDPKELNLRTIGERLKQSTDPWIDFDKKRVDLHVDQEKVPSEKGEAEKLIAKDEVDNKENIAVAKKELEKDQTSKATKSKLIEAEAVPEILETYNEKRNFKKTTEPTGGGGGSASGRAFVIQRHHASSLHYDLRLEENGALRSWAVPKGIPHKEGVKRLAIETEPHPFKYIDFEGVIPKEEYGGGTMWVFATGEYELIEKTEKKYKFNLKGPELNASFVLYKTRNNQWIWERKDDKGKSVFDLAYKPMLAEATKTFIDGKDLSYEIKWDGIRTLIHVEDDEIRILSKSGRDLSKKFPELVASIEKLRVQTAVLDGEIVCLDEQGRPVFKDVISRMHTKDESKIASLSKSKPAFCYLFDVLYLDGRDVCKESMWKRQEWVADIIKKNAYFRLSQGIVQGEALMEQMTKLGMEGIMIKNKNAAYHPNTRSQNWRKLKVRSTEDCYIIGYTPGQGDRAALLGSLHLQLASDGSYRGKVGTGFDHSKLKELKDLIDALPEAKAHKDAENNPENRASRWIEPSLLCEIQFASLTESGTYREPVFKKLIKGE